MLFLAILILITALVIAAVAAYFSIIGLTLLFVGSGYSIIVMGSALEVGKLIVVSFLHQYWEKLNNWLKTYLILATIVLMAITSAGIYGYLANGYNATSIKVSQLEANITANNKTIEDLKKQNTILVAPIEIELPKNNIPDVARDIDLVNTNKDKAVAQLNQLIQQKETRISEIKVAQAADKRKASEDIVLARAALEVNISKETEQIKLFNDRLAILDKEVDTWLQQGTGNIFTANGLQKARETKQLQEKERNQIDEQIKAKQQNIERLRNELTQQISSINKNLDDLNKYNDSRISSLETEITNDKQKLNSLQIDTDKRIAELIALKESKTKNYEQEIKTLNSNKEEQVAKNKAQIRQNEIIIQELLNKNSALQLSIINTDVGTFKFVANNFGIQLNQAVNWFIIIIMIVFDPLAVSLILCFNYMVKQHNTSKGKLEIAPVTIPTSTPTLTPTPTPSTTELPFQQEFTYIETTPTMKSSEIISGIKKIKQPPPKEGEVARLEKILEEQRKEREARKTSSN